MGKKKKHDYTDEYDQMDAADRLYQLELQMMHGEFPTGERNNDTEDDLMQAMTSTYRATSKDKEEDDAPSIFDEEENGDEDEYESDGNDYDDDENEEADESEVVRTLSFYPMPAYHRIIIDDGITPFSFDMTKLNHLTTCKLDLEKIRPEKEAREEYLEDLFGNLMNFIVSTRFPSAIMPAGYFEELFGTVANFEDLDLYRFFYYNDYVFIYFIDDTSYNELVNYLDDLDLSDQDMLDFIVNMAKMSINIHNCFDYHDENLLKALSEDDDANTNAYEDIIGSEVAEYIWGDDKPEGYEPEELNTFDELIEAFHMEDMEAYRKDMLQFLIDVTGDVILGHGIWDGYDLYDEDVVNSNEFVGTVTDNPVTKEVVEKAVEEVKAAENVQVTAGETTIKTETSAITKTVENAADFKTIVNGNPVETPKEEPDSDYAVVTEADVEAMVAKLTENQIKEEKLFKPIETPPIPSKTPETIEQEARKRNIIQKLKDLNIQGFDENWDTTKLQEFFKEKFDEIVMNTEPNPMPTLAPQTNEGSSIIIGSSIPKVPEKSTTATAATTSNDDGEHIVLPIHRKN